MWSAKLLNINLITKFSWICDEFLNSKRFLFPCFIYWWCNESWDTVGHMGYHQSCRILRHHLHFQGFVNSVKRFSRNGTAYGVLLLWCNWPTNAHYMGCSPWIKIQPMFSTRDRTSNPTHKRYQLSELTMLITFELLEILQIWLLRSISETYLIFFKLQHAKWPASHWKKIRVWFKMAAMFQT